jgi:hypothetical protein
MLYYGFRLHNLFMAQIHNTFSSRHVSAWWGHLQVHWGLNNLIFPSATLPTPPSVHTLGVRGMYGLCPFFVKYIIYEISKILNYYIKTTVKTSKMLNINCIKWFACVMVTRHVSCEVRIEFLNTTRIYNKFELQRVKETGIEFVGSFICTKTESSGRLFLCAATKLWIPYNARYV